MNKVSGDMTPNLGSVLAWLNWVGGADLPTSIVYYRGYLAFDRGMLIVDEEGHERWVVAPEVDDVATLMWRASEEGQVILVQHRLGPGDWCYIAMRTKAAQWKRREQ